MLGQIIRADVTRTHKMQKGNPCFGADRPRTTTGEGKNSAGNVVGNIHSHKGNRYLDHLVFSLCEYPFFGHFVVVPLTQEEFEAMGMRRFTRLTNGFSKKVENHEASIALHYMHYNFARVHQTLRVTPAMEAGISDHVWTLEEIVNLLAA